MLLYVLFYVFCVNWAILGPYFFIKNQYEKFDGYAITWILDGFAIILIECLIGIGIL